MTYNSALYNSDSLYYIVDDGNPDQGMLQLGANYKAGPNTNIPLFHSDGTKINIVITVISESPDSVQISIEFINW